MLEEKKKCQRNCLHFHGNIDLSTLKVGAQGFRYLRRLNCIDCWTEDNVCYKRGRVTCQLGGGVGLICLRCSQRPVTDVGAGHPAISSHYVFGDNALEPDIPLN